MKKYIITILFVFIGTLGFCSFYNIFNNPSMKIDNFIAVNGKSFLLSKIAYNANSEDYALQAIDSLLNSMVFVRGGSYLKGFIDSESYSSSQETIAVVSEFIRKVDSYRAEMGAVQNRLEATISNQENVIENVSDARSRIRDVDYAVETANMTQQSIIQQASTTILTQANQKTQIAMNLLQG